MKAITLKSFGDPTVLTLADIPTPQPSSTQLLVNVKTTALNRADLLQRRGKYPPPAGESAILGLEIAGVVSEVGTGVSQYRMGDRVFGLVGGGGYAEYCLIDEKVALPIPEHLSFAEAAAIPEAFLTASEALFSLGNLSAGEKILIHAAGSGVGTAAIQLAQQLDANIFATVGHLEKANKLKKLFPTVQTINYKEQDFEKIILELTDNKGVDVILDFIGASYLSRNLNSLAKLGRLICIGLMGGAKTEINLDTVLTKRLQIKGLRMRTQTLAEKSVMAQRFKEKWLDYFNDKRLIPMIDCILPIEDVIKAHEKMEANLNFGKIILTL